MLDFDFDGDDRVTTLDCRLFWPVFGGPEPPAVLENALFPVWVL
jgi:hypothetical protein